MIGECVTHSTYHLPLSCPFCHIEIPFLMVSNRAWNSVSYRSPAHASTVMLTALVGVSSILTGRAIVTVEVSRPTELRQPKLVARRPAANYSQSLLGPVGPTVPKRDPNRRWPRENRHTGFRGSGESRRRGSIPALLRAPLPGPWLRRGVLGQFAGLG